MGINKVNYGETTLIDISSDTVTAGSMLSGTTAHDNSGAAITGTIASKSSSDLTASGATVTAPAGYYASSASKSVASGTAGTPTATKGTVSNHSISVTPSVTNTTGYITGSTKTGTAVTVSASELVSGDKAISANGTNIDVANYSTVSVSVPSGSANLTTATATPSNSRQFITPYTVYGTEGKSGELSPTSMTVSLSAVNLVAGTTYFVTGELTASYSLFTHNYTLCGEWECTTTATSIKYLFDRTPFFDTVTMSSSSLYMSLASSSSSQIGADIDVSLTFYEMNGEYDGYSCVVVEPAPSIGIGTKTVTNSSNTATSLAFSSLSGEPKAFFVRCMAQLTRSSSYSYYYITAIRYNGTNTYGNYWRMSNGTFYADTSHYSFTYSNGTLTVTSSGARGSAGGSFYNGDYELTYIY